MTARESIVASVRATVGDVPVLLAGSRAVGNAHDGSDWDVAVVLSWRRALLSLRPLARAAAQLELDVGAPVTLSPLPASVLDRTPPRLFVWKLRREGVVLSAPPGFALGDPGLFVLDDEATFSYVASAAVYRLAGEDEKAGRHLAQLRQLRAGRYEPTAQLAAGELDAELVRELAGAPAPRRRALIRNAQYATLSLLRGRSRVRAATARDRVDARLAEAAGLLLAGDHDAAARRLPRVLRPRPVNAASVRETIVREWQIAHPLLGL